MARATFFPVINKTGGSLVAGPVMVSGFFDGLGYLANGTFAAALDTILVDTGTLPIVIGSTFTITGVYGNNPTNNDLQIFTSTVNLTGAGSLSFTPDLPSSVADNAILRIDAGYTIALAVGRPADLILASALADKTAGYAYKFIQFTGSIDTSASTKGNPVYLTSTGAYSLTADSAMKFQQIIARVETLANPGVLRGVIQQPLPLIDVTAPQTLTDAATIAWDMSLGVAAVVTLGGNRTLGAPTNIRAGSSGFLKIVQDGTGSRTLAYNAVWKFYVTPVLTTTAAAIDILYWYSPDGTNLYAWVLGKALDATQLTAGTMPTARYPGGAFNGASQLVQLTATPKYPAIDGSLITNLTPPAVGNVGTSWSTNVALDGSGLVSVTSTPVVGSANLIAIASGADNGGGLPAAGIIAVTAYSNSGANNISVASSLGAADSGKKVTIVAVYV